ncbi:SGNH/GDSL hydrolase family protein [Kroppenstedtia eburnea]|uniref:Lysophospholipase L1 n=1 Tax=Kroppenstedtia eburnea TaxID=714067 RepID=A0A1N7M5V5_9BACL|nr:SGNH/GDSL hydrolase family protein [Kroppenstedtia eburnea]EGK14632.1 lipase [Desmospora sp. 8437]QKI81844.1 SGNH/GDSL hydrolase family protein [Kroppenstedtia eburnea]SIS81460.1 Lysophospholipase L1 [Kroppenstedtia eburnea]
MRIKGNPVWIAFSLFSLFSLFFLIAGFGWAVTDVLHPPSEGLSHQEPRQEKSNSTETALLLTLGDSLTRGTGDADGQGYAGRVKESLRKEHHRISAVNLAVKGQTSDQLKDQVRQPRVRRLLGEARWITLTIGGNDLFQNSGQTETIDWKQSEKARKRYQKNLETTLSVIRRENPDTPVFLFGLYNPFGDLGQKETSNRIVGEWNRTLTETAEKFDKVVVIPVFDLFQLNPRAYLYSDHFHPNHKGYERMADRLLQAMEEKAEEVSTDAR